MKHKTEYFENNGASAVRIHTAPESEVGRWLGGKDLAICIPLEEEETLLSGLDRVKTMAPTLAEAIDALKTELRSRPMRVGGVPYHVIRVWRKIKWHGDEAEVLDCDSAKLLALAGAGFVNRDTGFILNLLETSARCGISTKHDQAPDSITLDIFGEKLGITLER